MQALPGTSLGFGLPSKVVIFLGVCQKATRKSERYKQVNTFARQGVPMHGWLLKRQPVANHAVLLFEEGCANHVGLQANCGRRSTNLFSAWFEHMQWN